MTARLLFFSRRLFKIMFGSALTLLLALSLFTGRPDFGGDIMPFKLFDAHPHLIADDPEAYPQLEPLPDGDTGAGVFIRGGSSGGNNRSLMHGMA